MSEQGVLDYLALLLLELLLGAGASGLARVVT